MTKHVSINLVPAGEYETRNYGILLVGETEHRFNGRGIHNRNSRHLLQVWDNAKRPDPAGSGQYIDPSGKVTAERYSYAWSAQCTVISAHPGESTPEGTALALGDVVTLKIQGYVIGEFQCRAKPYHNPHMVKVDTASSASRQHYIETGEYLAPGEGWS